jgi:hypothetical protein
MVALYKLVGELHVRMLIGRLTFNKELTLCQRFVNQDMRDWVPCLLSERSETASMYVGKHAHGKRGHGTHQTTINKALAIS